MGEESLLFGGDFSASPTLYAVTDLMPMSLKTQKQNAKITFAELTCFVRIRRPSMLETSVTGDSLTI